MYHDKTSTSKSAVSLVKSVGPSRKAYLSDSIFKIFVDTDY